MNGTTSLQQSSARYCEHFLVKHSPFVAPPIGLTSTLHFPIFQYLSALSITIYLLALPGQYFSSLERLRLAQHCNAKTRAASLSSACVTKGVCKRDTRPTLGRRNSSYFKNPTIRRKPPSPTSDTFSQSDAQWFLRLPPKVQRGHFTKEERDLLSGHLDLVVPDAADQTYERKLYKLSQEANRSVPTLRPSSSSTLSSISTFDLHDPIDSAIDMDESVIWFDDDNEVDLDSKLQLDDYHQFINKAAEHKRSPAGRGPSFRRALSLSSLPFGTKPLQSPVPPTPPLPVDVQQQTSRRRSSQVQSPTHVKQPSVPAIETSTRHYQDPEARLKLRVYLASPQKFDEAIEFGFPSLEDKESLSLHRPSLSRSHNTAPCKTFLHDDCPSLFDALDSTDDNDETTSLPERDYPYTPVDDKFHSDATLLSPSDAASSGSGSTLFTKPAYKPVIRHNQGSEPFAQLLAGSREMTLRMTLTRPDLRADEKALYASTTGDDPLALEHLPPAKKEEDIWDSLPKDRNVVKRIWRRVSGRS